MTRAWSYVRPAALLALTAGLAAACKERQAPPPSGAPSSGAATSTAAAPTIQKMQLAMFAPLPATMAKRPPDPTQVALGRRLYYENVLSEGHDVSCNSCHPLNGYGADGRRVSFGHRGQEGGRNSPTTYNAAGHAAQFWDGRAADVEAQAKGPILNPAEMGMPDSAAVIAHLRGDPRYVSAFRAAFPGEAQPVTYSNVARAIGAFERGLVTPSRWDRFLQGDSAALTPAEKHGFAVFASVGCQACHSGPYVGGGAFQKLGMRSPWPNAKDSGRVAVTHQPQDVLVFKVPSLRNVAKTGPYFHDGSVATLPEAVRLMAYYQLGRELPSDDVAAITTWLGALTGEIPVGYVAEPPLPEGARGGN